MGNNDHRYERTRLTMCPGDVIEIDTEGKTRSGVKWKGAADLHFIGWITGKPVFYVEHFDEQEGYLHSEAYELIEQYAVVEGRFLNLRAEGRPDPEAYTLEVSFLWKGAVAMSWLHWLRGTPQDVLRPVEWSQIETHEGQWRSTG